MMILIWIVTSIIIFSIIVLVHEYGHFKTARIFWVRVEEFWLWIPPRAKKLFTDKKWTLFSLNWLPLWGFVKLTWEQVNTFLIYNEKKKLLNNLSVELAIEKWEKLYDKQGNILTEDLIDSVVEKLEENKAEYNLANKPAWQQIIIILAWVFMNFLLATLIFAALFLFWVKPIGINTQIETDRTMRIIPTMEKAIELWIIQQKPWALVNPIAGSIAEEAWIIPGDLVTSVNQSEIADASELLSAIQSNAWVPINITIERTDDAEKIETIIVAVTPWEDGKIWSYLWDSVVVNQDFEFKYWPIDSLKYWALETYNQSILTFKAIGTLLRKLIRPETTTERKEAMDQVSWPIWIVDFISWALSNGVIFLIIIGAIISINLWVFNLLPIPALDGWRFVFIVINGLVLKIFWKKAIGEQTEWIIHVSFFIVLILLSILIAYNDILKIYLWN